ncbi:hypothetical protein G6F46_004106 [Rhizopus delemar]|uniref:EF-hand domain-containing protein n=2 Tax=Rhizopus TaxID=4842 RepID=A0A9P6Z758_9FUNG|nr:hypothetical protein G6F55_003647 [Rhizopus delemar]KAG1547527.1 hypothetical protein G6F51_004212 [Rhizopus arrhizus]KAG1514085.1 hypothetical protein G6F53_003945 [Rhizopus delemar]KAG1560138.1 hypothetical protein G6F49_002962 [Rhizopus delemar]KAG1572135.1 hypothetical protein G6F50_004001 [Rhizopus delemar]
MESMTKKQPIPFVILKVQLKQLVEQYDTTGKGFIFTRDLLTLIDRFEVNKDVVLLSDSQKKAILPYTMSNPDLEMTPDDILNLLKLVCASPQISISAPTTGSSQVIVESRTRSSGSLKINKSTPWKRRSSIYNNLHKEQQELKGTKRASNQKDEIIMNNSTTTTTTTATTHDDNNNKNRNNNEEDNTDDDDQYSTQDLARYYRRSLALTQRLKSSEKSLASIARDNEDRIVQLQNRVEDMNLEVLKQRKEIQEYKGKEKKSLEQISALELHISQIHRSETDQKQVYMSIKLLFDEKCREAQELQELLKQKEADLEKTESLLNNFQQEVQLLSTERKRLIELQNDLELELEISANAHQQLAEQRSENEKLKEIIDTLKTDLDEALLLSNDNEFMIKEIERRQSNASIKTLEIELDQEEKLKTVQDEKDYYKSIATEAKEDLDRVQNELEYLKKALNDENKSLVHELTGLKLKYNDNPTIINIQPEDPWSQSRMTRRTSKKKKRTVHDYHESISSNPFINTPLLIQPQPQLRVMNRKDDKIVTNTVTFALYTVLVYFFGIITSTFLIDSQAGDIPSALAAAAAASGQPKSKVWEIVFYWLQKLLVEPQGLPAS